MKERLLPILVVSPLLLGLPAALRSPIIAAAMATVVMLLMLLGILGLDRTSVWIMVAAFALVPWDKLLVPGLKGFGISDVLFVLSVGLALPRLLTRRIWLPQMFVIGSILFVTFAVLATLRSPNPGESYYYAARVILTFIGIPLLLVWWSPRGKVLTALVLAYAIGTGISVLAGHPDLGGQRNFGLTQHPNALGYTAVLTLSLLPFLSRTLTRAHRSWICASVFGIAYLGIMTSGSRAALVVALVLLALIPAAERSILAVLAVIGSGLVAILLLAQRVDSGGQGQDALSRLMGNGDVAGSNRERVEGVETVWSLALDHPFLGSGFTFSDFVGHNAYVQIAAAAGFLGLAAFVMVCASMVTPMVMYEDVHSRLVYPAIVFLIAAPVSPNLTDRYLGFLLGLSMVGVVAAHEARRERSMDASVQQVPRRLRRRAGRSDGEVDAPGAPLISG